MLIINDPKIQYLFIKFPVNVLQTLQPHFNKYKQQFEGPYNTGFT